MAKTFQITLYKIQLIQLHFKIPEKREKSYGYYTQLIHIIKSLKIGDPVWLIRKVSGPGT